LLGRARHQRPAQLLSTAPSGDQAGPGRPPRLRQDLESARRPPRHPDVQRVRAGGGAGLREDGGRGARRGDAGRAGAAPDHGGEPPDQRHLGREADPADSRNAGGAVRAQRVRAGGDLGDRFVRSMGGRAGQGAGAADHPRARERDRAGPEARRLDQRPHPPLPELEAMSPQRGNGAKASLPIKLLIADVDGTLVTGQKILTDAACRAVERLRAAGIELAITSGRPPRGMAMLVEPLELTTPVAAFNGGMFVKPDLTTVIQQSTLPLEVAREVLDFLLQAGLDVWVYRDADWFIRKREAPHVDREQWTVKFEPTVTKDLSSVLERAVKIVGVSDDHGLVERTEAALRKRVAGHASAARSQPYYLDVTHPDANKGVVARYEAQA